MMDKAPARRKTRHQLRERRLGQLPDRPVRVTGEHPDAPAAGKAQDYRLLLLLCPAAIWIQGGNRVLFANQAAQQLFGAADQSALIGIHWHRLVVPDCWAEAESHCTVPGAGAGPHVPRLEMNYLTLDGRLISAESSSICVDFEGRPAVMLVVQDIRERNSIGQEQHEQRLKLEEQLLERTANLRQALDDARLADRAKDRFLANVSHELRTPLSGMIGLLELALARCTDETLRAYIDRSSRAGKHLSRIVNDLLDLSKVAAGRMELESIPFSLRDLLNRAREVIAHKAEAKGLGLRFRVDNGIPDQLQGDPFRLEQILLNLTGNAIKFTNAGEVDVHAVLVARHERHVSFAIEITDTGIGMTAGEISGLFQPFAQATSATSREFGGTGLGLALSQRLAEAMGGRITVSSRKGRGSVFSVSLRLPFDDAPATPPDAEARSPVDYSQARVLLVEDDPINTEIVTELLRSVGIYPEFAGNGHEAAALLAQRGAAAFDLVLMDIQMPVMDGHAATRLIRSWAGYARLPIVAMSAHAMEHEQQASIAAGMNDHVSKPFDTASFFAVLDKWLPRARTTGGEELPTLRCADVAAALRRFAGNEQRYRHWLARFVEDSPKLAPEVRKAMVANERERAAALVHGFKGGAGTLGLDDLRGRAEALEHAIHKQGDAAPELRQLERAIDEARREIIAAFGL